MVVKFFANKKGGSVAAIDYLLNNRVENGTARVLEGNEELTKKFINLIKNKQKITVGCLSFEEQNIDEELKFKLMNRFEEMLFAGLNKEQYNILWIEHTDKNRLELNFVIPKLELSSKRALQPYFHRADLHRVESWQDLTNLTYNLTNPKDPVKSRHVNTSKTEIRLTKNYESIDIEIQKLVKNGKITSRGHLLKVLKQNDFEITRVADEYISLKLPNSKKARRFKHGIYSSKFTSLDSVETFGQEKNNEIKNFNNMNVGKEIDKLALRLHKYTQDKAIKNIKKYPYQAHANNQIEQRFILEQGDSTNDKTGTTITERIRAKRETQQRTLQELEDERSGVQKLFTQNTEPSSSRIRKFRDRYNQWISDVAKSIEGVIHEIRKIKTFNRYKEAYFNKAKYKNQNKQRN